jgi:hypothetical protein
MSLISVSGCRSNGGHLVVFLNQAERDIRCDGDGEACGRVSNDQDAPARSRAAWLMAASIASLSRMSRSEQVVGDMWMVWWCLCVSFAKWRGRGFDGGRACEEPLAGTCCGLLGMLPQTYQVHRRRLRFGRPRSWESLLSSHVPLPASVRALLSRYERNRYLISSYLISSAHQQSQ